MEELNLDFWRQRGYLIPNTYTIDEDQTDIDYTIQYLFAVPVKKVFQNKLTYLENQLLPFVIEKLNYELTAEENGEFDCLDNTRSHLGEIFDDNFFKNPCQEAIGITCLKCNQQSPDTFQICWLCGHAFQGNSRVNAYANVFIEHTVNFGIDDLIHYQNTPYNEGPSNFRKMVWMDLSQPCYVDLCNLPQSSLKTNKGEFGDHIFETEELEIFVRFNPLPVIAA